MLTIALLFLLLLSGIVLTFAAWATRNVEYGQYGQFNFHRFFVTAGIVVTVAFMGLTFGQSVKVIGANEVAVPVTFGKVGQPIQSGLHLVKPWTEITKYPTRPQTYSVVANVRTNQSGQAAVRISARWATDRDNARELFLQIRKGQDAIQGQLISPNTQGAAGAFYGGLDNATAVNGQFWEDNAAGVQAKLAAYLAPYGIRVDNVQIREVNPTKATNDSIARVAIQQQQTIVAEESVKTAKQQALQQVAAANGLRDAADKLAGLTPTQLQLLCLQAGERIANGNAEKGIPTYALPCQAGGSVIAK